MFMALRTFDRVINSSFIINKRNVRYVIAACFMLAEKSEEIYTTDPAKILMNIGITMNERNMSNLKKIEIAVFKALNF